MSEGGEAGEETRALQADVAHQRALAAARAAEQATGDALLKAVALVNGGAAFATVLVLCATIREMRELAFRLVAPLALFGFGMTVAAFALGFVHLARSRETAALADRDRAVGPPFYQDNPATRRAAQQATGYLRLGTVAVLVAMASAVLGFLLSGVILLISLR